MNRLLKVIFAGLIAIFLTACGGSSGGGDTTPPPSTELPPTEGTPPSEGIPPGGTTPPSGSTPPPIEETKPPIETEPGETLNFISIGSDTGGDIGVGEEIQFKIYAHYTIDGHPSRDIYPTEGIKWETSNNSIASINSNGLLKGVSAGQVNVEATYDGLSTSIPIDITHAYVTELIMSPTSKTIKDGDTFQITARGKQTDGTIVPINIDGWTSSNNAIADVDQGGVVVGLEKGTVQIEAFYLNNLNHNLFAETIVTVE